jgi:ribosomal protein L17
MDLSSSTTPNTVIKEKKPRLRGIEACKRQIIVRKEALTTYRKHKTTENREKYKEARKTANRIILKAKRAHLRTFCQTINHNTLSSKVWQKLWAIKGS